MTAPITYTKEQTRVIGICVSQAVAGAPITVVAGEGGTGKSVCIVEICRRLIKAGRSPVLATVVGKAAGELQGKLRAAGLPLLVTTLSKLCDKTFTSQASGEMVQVPKSANLPTNSVIIVDEWSMVGKRYLIEHLVFAVRGIPILGFGDEFQIPPVQDSATGLLAATNLRLTQPQRQAAKSPILRLARALREDTVRFFTPTKDPQRLEQQRHIQDFHRNPGLTINSVIDWERALLSAYPIDRIPAVPVLAFTREEVDTVNCLVRRRYGIHKARLPLQDEIIRCDLNNYKAGVYNGEHFRVESIESVRTDPHAVEVRLQGVSEPVILPLNVDLTAWRGVPNVLRWSWGYATTIHRSQGSEWPHVRLIIGETLAGKASGEPGRRLLYTGVSRAKRQLDIFCIDFDRIRIARQNRARIRARLVGRINRAERAALRPPKAPGEKVTRKPRKSRKGSTPSTQISLGDLL